MTLYIEGETFEFEDEEERDEFYKTEKTLAQARGISRETAVELMAEVGTSREDILDAGVEGIAELDGWGETTGERVITQVESSIEGFSGETPLKIEYRTGEEQPYLASFPELGKARSGYSVKGAVQDLIDRTTKQQLLDLTQD